MKAGRAFLRREMTELERFVLLQISDTAWKDHLLAMDHLKSGIGLRGFAEQDPRVAYKREGARLFQEMHAGVCDRVTDMIFKVRLTAGTEMRSVFQVSNMVHEQLGGYDRLASEAAAQAAGTPQKVATIVQAGPARGPKRPLPLRLGQEIQEMLREERRVVRPWENNNGQTACLLSGNVLHSASGDLCDDLSDCSLEAGRRRRSHRQEL